MGREKGEEFEQSMYIHVVCARVKEKEGGEGLSTDREKEQDKKPLPFSAVRQSNNGKRNSQYPIKSQNKRKICIRFNPIQSSIQSAIAPLTPPNRANSLPGICRTLPCLTLSCPAYQNQIDQRHHKSSRSGQIYSALPHPHP